MIFKVPFKHKPFYNSIPCIVWYLVRALCFCLTFCATTLNCGCSFLPKVKMYITPVSFCAIQCFVFSVNYAPGRASLKVLIECCLCVILDSDKQTKSWQNWAQKLPFKMLYLKRIRSVKPGVRQNLFPMTYFFLSEEFLPRHSV